MPAARAEDDAKHVQRVAVARSRPLVTLGPEEGVWMAPGTTFLLPTAGGCFFRLRPPQGVAERAREVEAALLAAGALGVKVELGAEERAVPTRDEARVDPRQTSRQVVLELAEKANVADRKLFAASLEEGLEAAGL